MHFAILGNHADGLNMASALVASGRHRLLVYTTAVPAEHRQRWGSEARLVADLEAVLADPGIEAVLVAGSPVNRPTQLRRALQSERHVLCVHPADKNPDVAYEAAMIQRDTGGVLLPLLPEALHPGAVRLGKLFPAGGLRLVEMERWSRDTVLIGEGMARKPALLGWDVLRRLGGEVAEVTAFAEHEVSTADRPLFLSGRFERGGVFRVSFLPHQAEPRWRLTVTGEDRQAALVFPEGWPGRAVLTWRGDDGDMREETWEHWDPWAALVEAFEAAVGHRPSAGSAPAELRPEAITTVRHTAAARPNGADGITAVPRGLIADGRQPMADSRWPTWQDEVRSLELDDGARRSVERRRASTLEYPQATEEAGLKGTMTLVGCGLVWLFLLLLVLSVWIPVLGRLIMPALLVFLVLQVGLWLISRGRGREGRETPR
jgi:predicted dehydrogenase